MEGLIGLSSSTSLSIEHVADLDLIVSELFAWVVRRSFEDEVLLDDFDDDDFFSVALRRFEDDELSRDFSDARLDREDFLSDLLEDFFLLVLVSPVLSRLPLGSELASKVPESVGEHDDDLDEDDLCLLLDALLERREDRLLSVFDLLDRDLRELCPSLSIEETLVSGSSSLLSNSKAYFVTGNLSSVSTDSSTLSIRVSRLSRVSTVFR